MVAQEDESEFVPRHILITGGAGFIASHVAIRLVQRYAQYKVAHSALRLLRVRAGAGQVLP